MLTSFTIPRVLKFRPPFVTTSTDNARRGFLPMDGPRHWFCPSAGRLLSWILVTHVLCWMAPGPLVASEGAADDTPTAAAMVTAERLLTQSHFQGGLVVIVGDFDADLACSIAATSGALVQMLVQDDERLATIRQQIRDASSSGRLSAVTWSGSRLPYADGLVNLLIVDRVNLLKQDELDRVLAPLGTAFSRDGARFAAFHKPWPDDVDEWSHARHDASGNAVSRDQLAGPPRYLQWAALPRWNRGVKTSNLVSTHGRLFYILDDSDFGTRSPTWSLIARDAANGVRLWRRELASWIGSKGGKKVGPAQANRRLVATEDAVYVTLEEGAPVSVLNAATGDVIRTFDQTGPAEEFCVTNGVLLVLVNPNTDNRKRRGQGEDMRVVAVDTKTGKTLWQYATKMILPLTLAADDEQVVVHDGRVIRSFDLMTGESHWVSTPTGQEIAFWDQANPDQPGAKKSQVVLAPQFAPTLVLYEDVVAFAGGCQLNVVSATDGHELWRADYSPSNYSVPVDLFGFDGSLWGPDTKMNFWRPLDDHLAFNGYDPLTGVLKRHVQGTYGFRFQHHRCHQMKVVGHTIIAARAGVEFVDTQTGAVTAHHWLRGSCYYGVMPANGRLYVPPHNCACYVRAKLSGFMALNAHPPAPAPVIADESRLQRGPAYGTIERHDVHPATNTDWPTYRHDEMRSGRTGARVKPDLLLGWRKGLGGRLTSPVVANGRVYLASADMHTVSALDANTGELQWQLTLNGPIDSPPTVAGDLVLCGCRDGSVSAFRAADGALVWRFIAAPEERVIVSRGQLESVWPVNGSVLLLNNVIYFAAGRSSFLDDGMRFYGLDPETGRVLVDHVLSTRHSDGSEILDEQSVDGFLNDVLSSDGERIFMRHQVLNTQGEHQADRIPHLHSPDGYLSADSTERLLWTYAPSFTSLHQGAFYDARLSRMLFPSGRILVEDDDTIYGFGQNRYDRPLAEPGGQWALFAAEKKLAVPLDLTAVEYRKVALSRKQTVAFRWWKRLPIQVRAMVRTKDVLFVAGPNGNPTTQAALEGRGAASLLAVSPTDGTILTQVALPSTPVWDGMAATEDNLFVTLADGTVVCLWSADSGRPGTSLSPAAWSVSLPPVEVTEEPGLVGHWRFDEGAGLLARDCSGHGHDAEVSGEWAKDAFGTCLVTDGSPHVAVVGDSADFQFGNDSFTLAIWANVAGFGTRLLGKEAFPKNWWVINLLPDGRVELVLGEGSGAAHTVRVKTATALTTNTWTHLAAVVDREANEVRWYVDGVLDAHQVIPKTMTGGLYARGRDITIPSTYHPFRGRFGDFRIYRIALTAKRLDEIFSAEALPKQ